jgi:hypothetical protein
MKTPMEAPEDDTEINTGIRPPQYKLKYPPIGMVPGHVTTLAQMSKSKKTAYLALLVNASEQRKARRDEEVRVARVARVAQTFDNIKRSREIAANQLLARQLAAKTKEEQRLAYSAADVAATADYLANSLSTSK